MKIIDYVNIKPTLDTSWHTVTVPAALDGYDVAIVIFTGIDGTSTRANMFTTDIRPTGVSLTAPATGKGTATLCSTYYVPIDVNRQFEITCNDSGTDCWLIGGFKSTEAVAFNNDWMLNDITPTATDQTAENIDISSYLGGDTAIAAIVRVRTGSGQRFGYAYDAVSTTDVLYATNADTHIIVPVTSGQVRLSRDNAAVNVYLVGYIKSGITLNPTRSDTINTSSVWTAGSVPDRTTEDIAFMRVGRNGSNSAQVREVGRTTIPNTNTIAGSLSNAPLLLDANGEIEYNTDLTFDVKPEWFATNDTGGATTELGYTTSYPTPGGSANKNQYYFLAVNSPAQDITLESMSVYFGDTIGDAVRLSLYSGTTTSDLTDGTTLNLIEDLGVLSRTASGVNTLNSTTRPTISANTLLWLCFKDDSAQMPNTLAGGLGDGIAAYRWFGTDRDAAVAFTTTISTTGGTAVTDVPIFMTYSTGGGTTYTITSIDGDNDVQAGQANVDIIMTATTGVTVSTLGGEPLTINGVT